MSSSLRLHIGMPRDLCMFNREMWRTAHVEQRAVEGRGGRRDAAAAADAAAAESHLFELGDVE